MVFGCIDMFSAFYALFMVSVVPEATPCDPKTFSDPSKVCQVSDGVVLPYPVTWVMRGFAKCKNGKFRHQAVDIGGLGPEYGLGDPLRSMVKSEVVFVGRRTEKPKQFGQIENRSKTVERHRKKLPAFKEIEGYGKVYFFTQNYGSFRTGEFLSLKALEGKYADHEFRYMHMGAIRPDIKKGTVLEAGEVFGLMGGTAVMHSPPHVHVDITDPNGDRLDVMPILGLESRHKPCLANGSSSSKSATVSKSTGSSKKSAKRTKASTASSSKKSRKTHQITKGETLSSIAEKYSVSLQALMKANSITNPDRIWEGQTIVLTKRVKKEKPKKIDQKKWRIHTIAKGESLSAIAVKYGCSVSDLMKWNGMKNDRIFEGKRLKIAR